MSFSIRSSVSSTILLGEIARQLPGQFQQALNKTRDAGLAYLRDDAGIHVKTGDLRASADAGDNQYSVYFKVAQMPQDDGKMYGIYQNQGWHDRGGGWHDGYHFMENTAAFAIEFLRRQVNAALFGIASMTETVMYPASPGSAFRPGTLGGTATVLTNEAYGLLSGISQTYTGPTFSTFNPGSFA